METIDYIRQNKRSVQQCLFGVICGLIILALAIVYIFPSYSEYTFVSQEFRQFDDNSGEYLVIDVIGKETAIRESFVLVDESDCLNVDAGDTIRIKWLFGQFAGYEIV